MNLGTRERLLQAATELFARSGFRGASVRRICDLANTNPGAVSYHFGGKRQLYRAALAQGPAREEDRDAEAMPLHVAEVLDRVLDRIGRSIPSVELLLRDLADGGEVAVEALEPSLRAAVESLSLAVGEEPSSLSASATRALLIDLAAPVFLLTAAWPLLQRALELDPRQRRAIVAASCRRTLASHGFADLV
jgi:AcrR family transcriptional regulator